MQTWVTSVKSGRARFVSQRSARLKKALLRKAIKISKLRGPPKKDHAAVSDSGAPAFPSAA